MNLLLMVMVVLFLPPAVGVAGAWVLARIADAFCAVVNPEPVILEPKPSAAAPGRRASYEEQLSWSCDKWEIEAMRKRYPERFGNG